MKALIDELIALRTLGAPSSAPFIRALLMMKGINPDVWHEQSTDDPTKIAALESMLRDFRGQSR